MKQLKLVGVAVKLAAVAVLIAVGLSMSCTSIAKAYDDGDTVVWGN